MVSPQLKSEKMNTELTIRLLHSESRRLPAGREAMFLEWSDGRFASLAGRRYVPTTSTRGGLAELEGGRRDTKEKEDGAWINEYR